MQWHLVVKFGSCAGEVEVEDAKNPCTTYIVLLEEILLILPHNAQI